jgi:hypothetical protein
MNITNWLVYEYPKLIGLGESIKYKVRIIINIKPPEEVKLNDQHFDKTPKKIINITSDNSNNSNHYLLLPVQ